MRDLLGFTKKICSAIERNSAKIIIATDYFAEREKHLLIRHFKISKRYLFNNI